MQKVSSQSKRGQYSSTTASTRLNIFCTAHWVGGAGIWCALILKANSERAEVKMFWWIVSALLLLFLAYATKVLFFGLDEEVGTSLSDFIKEAEGN